MGYSARQTSIPCIYEASGLCLFGVAAFALGAAAVTFSLKEELRDVQRYRCIKQLVRQRQCINGHAATDKNDPRNSADAQLGGAVLKLFSEEPSPLLEDDIKQGIEGCIGDTPLIKIKSLSDATGCEVLAKAEVPHG